MKYLTVEQVLFIQWRLISVTGGSQGIRDLGLLESAVARPRASFEEKDLYPDPFSKAAALMDSLINNHPFVDGFKRTGISSAALFLQRNGWKLIAVSSELESITLRVAVQRMPIDELTDWLRSNCVQM